MIWVRIFEHDKPINSSKLHDCYMGALPEVGDLVSTGGGDEEQYEVKSSTMMSKSAKKLH